MLESIKSILAEQLGVPEISISDNKTLEDIGADSLDAVELAMCFEDEFGIQISDDEIYVMKDMTVGDLAAAIEKKVQP
jgi:acyl carrier protein